MRVALVNPSWSYEGSIYFGCRAPHLPLEEVFFLLFLSYLAVVMFAVFERRSRARSRNADATGSGSGGRSGSGDAGSSGFRAARRYGSEGRGA